MRLRLHYYDLFRGTNPLNLREKKIVRSKYDKDREQGSKLNLDNMS